MDSKRVMRCGKFVALWTLALIVFAAPAAGEYLNETVTDKNDPAYWLDQGGLFATYGNYPMAIEAYKKALALDPENQDALFNMGVAYGEMGEIEQALMMINQAISKDPQNGRFFYGRAWVLLRSGQGVKAMPDFKKAASLGNLDAILYLQQ